MEQLLLWLRTVARLRPRQAYAQFVKRVRPFCSVRPVQSVRLRSGVGIGPVLAPPTLANGDESFCFLNRVQRVPTGAVEWAAREMPKLWRYNLHYFDYLLDPTRSDAANCRLISDWIANHPMNVGDGWEPYPVSLRMVNWIKFFLRREKPPEEAWLLSLATQAAWLERNLERHLLANHYFKNAVALVFAGLYFEGPDADRWRRIGWTMLDEELAEQFLHDGGHYERSPMYHAICLVDCLDVMNMIGCSDGVVRPASLEPLTTTIKRAVDYLRWLCLPDGDIALFNDAAFGIAPRPAHIVDYARRVTGYEPPNDSGDLEVRALPDSGYFVCGRGRDRIVIDCGPVGPDYQPGHAHCDTLSYELAIDGRRLIVDSGVFDYEASSERAYARSTRAHNTVVVDGVEQSEIWGVFRVARRARPIRASLRRGEDGRVIFEGAHDGYCRLPGRPIHARSITYDGQGVWDVGDRLDGKGSHRMESYVHLHPDFRVTPLENHLALTTAAGRVIAIVEPLTPCDVRVERGWYFPEFGVKVENDVIVLSRTGEAPFGLGYRVTKTAGG